MLFQSLFESKTDSQFHAKFDRLLTSNDSRSTISFSGKYLKPTSKSKSFLIDSMQISEAPFRTCTVHGTVPSKFETTPNLTERNLDVLRAKLNPEIVNIQVPVCTQLVFLFVRRNQFSSKAFGSRKIKGKRNMPKILNLYVRGQEIPTNKNVR